MFDVSETEGQGLLSLKKVAYGSVSIMINMKLVDSAVTEVSNVVLSSLQKALEPMNCLNSCFPYKEKPVWYRFLM